MELTRFFLVAVAGVFLDISLSWVLASQLGVPLWFAASCGFLTAAVMNYTLHELWTFRAGARRLSMRRAAKYGGVLALTLGARLGTIALLQQVLWNRDHFLVILTIAAGVSFVVNFVASKLFVFVNPLSNVDGFQMPDISQKSPLDDADWQVPTYEEALYGPKGHAYALVIPVVNEGDRIRGQLERIRQACLPVDVIVADGGSTDGSLDPGFVRSAGVRAVLTKTGPGKLSAQLRMAYAWCIRSGYAGIVTIDGNGKDGIEAIVDMVAGLEAGYDYIQGSRYLPGGAAENTPLERTIANRFVHAPLLSLSGGHWFTDTTNGFRSYSVRYLTDPRVKPFRDIFHKYELLFYLTVRAGQIGMRVAQIPVRRGYPKNSAVPTKIAGLRGKFDVLKQTFAAATGRYQP